MILDGDLYAQHINSSDVLICPNCYIVHGIDEDERKIAQEKGVKLYDLLKLVAKDYNGKYVPNSQKI